MATSKKDVSDKVRSLGCLKNFKNNRRVSSINAAVIFFGCIGKYNY
jgi:hypothetical protein